MGIVLLLFANRITSYDYLYDYRTMEMKIDTKLSLLTAI